MAADAASLSGVEGVYCKFCASKVMRTSVAELVEHEFALPRLPSEQGAPAAGGDSEEVLQAFWVVRDKFDFDNVGFTKTVDGRLKYLICADCDIGPIGYLDISAEDRIYLACDRVNHAPPESGPRPPDPALVQMAMEQMRAQGQQQ